MTMVFAALVGGILAGRYLPLPAGVWAAAGLAALLAAFASIWRAHLHALTSAAIGAGIFCAGAFSGTMAYHRFQAGHIASFMPGRPILATVRGRVVTTPQFRQSETAFWQAPKTTFDLRVDGIRRTDGRWTAAAGRLPITVGEPVEGLALGDGVELVGRLHPIYPPSNPGQHHWRETARLRGVLAAFSVPGADGVIRLTAGSPGLRLFWYRLRGLVRGSFAEGDGGEGGALLEALVLGERDPALRRLNETMVEAGVAHLLSISGLHLGIFLGMVYLLCRACACPPRRSAIIVLAVLAVYVLLAEPRAPLLRAATMAAAICLAAIFGRNVTTPNALATAGAVLLVVDPLQLLTPGFQLSFGIVGGIIVLYAPIRRLLFGRWLRRRGLIVFRDPGVSRWLHYRAADAVIATVCLSLAAYVSAAPLVAYHFGLFSPYAPVLSILLLPVMVAVLLPAYASMALGLVAPNLSAAIGGAAAGAAEGLGGLVRSLRGLPGLSFDVRPVPVWLVVGAYAALALWALAGGRRTAKVAAVVATLILAAAVVWTQRPAARPAHAALHVLDVGHGSMTVLHAADGQTILFDAGSLDRPGPYRQILRPFLRAKRLPWPETAFISHANIDHFNALFDLLEHKPPRRVYLNEFFGRCADDSPETANLLNRLSRAGVEVVRLRRGQTVKIGEVRVEVLWPPAIDEAPGLDANDSSLVLRVSGGGTSVLLPGDVGRRVEELLVAPDAASVRADALMLPHHGSLTPTLQDFIRAVDPRVILQSASYRRDTPEMRAALGGRSRYVTCRDGWIHLELDAAGVSVETSSSR